MGEAIRLRWSSDDADDEFTIVNRRVVSNKQGGELEIPQNGFVLSCAPAALAADTAAALMAGRVSYRFRQAFPTAPMSGFFWTLFEFEPRGAAPLAPGRP